MSALKKITFLFKNVFVKRLDTRLIYRNQEVLRFHFRLGWLVAQEKQFLATENKGKIIE